jgi:hypothetical protein
MGRCLLFLSFLCAACGTPTAKDEATDNEASASLRKCIDECTHANQMRAVAAESIVADCRQSCARKGPRLEGGPGSK